MLYLIIFKLKIIVILILKKGRVALDLLRDTLSVRVLELVLATPI